MALKQKCAMSPELAQTLALQGLTFLASDGQRLARFLELTGIGPPELRAWAETPRLQTAVLEHLLADESLLLVFASEAGCAPEACAKALTILQAGRAAHER